MIALSIVSSELCLMSVSEFYDFHNCINLRFEVSVDFLKKPNREAF